MFGLMRPAKSCGKPKTAHRIHYCGTCKTMGQQFGQKTRLLLNYDAVFLAELLSTLAGEKTQDWNSSLQAVNQCFKIPKQSEQMPASLRYAAAANVFLSELKTDDHIRDRAKIKYKFARWWLSNNFKRATQQLGDWGLDTNFFWQQVEAQSHLEKLQKNDFQTFSECLEHYSQSTAQMTAALFAQAAAFINQPATAEQLYQIGSNLGKLAYALDAFEDLEQDIDTKQFNPLALYFRTVGGSIAEVDLEAARQLILQIEENLSASLAVLPIEKAQIEQFQARSASNIALRLYQDRTIPQTLGQKMSARWQNAKNAASQLICEPNSWGKKLQYQLVSIVFFILPTLSVEFSQQKSQVWGSLGILTAILASVGLAKSALPISPKTKKQSLWQRIKNRFSRKQKSSYCEDWEACDTDDCCEDCVATLLLFILGFLVASLIFGALVSWIFALPLMSSILNTGAVLLGVLVLFSIFMAIRDEVIMAGGRNRANAREARAERRQIKKSLRRSLRRPEVKPFPNGKAHYEIINQGDTSKPLDKNRCFFRITQSNNAEMIEGEWGDNRKKSTLYNFYRDLVPKTGSYKYEEDLMFLRLLDFMPYEGAVYKFYIPVDDYEKWGLTRGSNFIEIEAVKPQ